MTKKNIICILASVVIMIVLPWLAVTFVEGDGTMAVCFLLFYVVNPLSAVAVGIFSGKNIKTSWFQPVLLAILFLVGTWIIFDIGELAFIRYALIYFLLGIIVMMFVSFLAKRKKDKFLSVGK